MLISRTPILTTDAGARALHHGVSIKTVVSPRPVAVFSSVTQGFLLLTAFDDQSTSGHCAVTLVYIILI
jgi:hypothetical protein